MNNDIFLYIEDNKALGKNGVFAMGFEINLVERYSIGMSDYEALDDLWNKALKDMPTGSAFLKQDIFLESNFDTSAFPDKTYLQKATKKYFKGREHVSHKSFVFFILPQMHTIPNKIANPFKGLKKEKFESFDDNINAFINTVEQIVNYLSAGKILSGKAFKIREFSSKEMKDYYDYYFNNFQTGYVTDRELKGGYMQIGDKLMGAICTRDEDSMPEKFSPLQIDRDLSDAKYTFYHNIGDLFNFQLVELLPLGGHKS